VCISQRGFYIWTVSCQSTLVVIWNISHPVRNNRDKKQHLWQQTTGSIYSTNNSTLPFMIQLQSEPWSRIKLFKIVNHTFSVYIIVWCVCMIYYFQQLDTNYTVCVALFCWPDIVTGLLTKLIHTWHRQGFRFWMSFVPGTHFYWQNTRFTKPAAKSTTTAGQDKDTHRKNTHVFFHVGFVWDYLYY